MGGCGGIDRAGLRTDLDEHTVDDLLTARHVDHAFFLGPGEHDDAFAVPRSLAFLRDHTAAAR